LPIQSAPSTTASGHPRIRAGLETTSAGHEEDLTAHTSVNRIFAAARSDGEHLSFATSRWRTIGLHCPVLQCSFGKTMNPWKNQLYFGDNLRILRDEIPDEHVDLIYLDPPFNSNANYNVLFAEKSGEKSAAQIAVFTDTWQWSADSEAAFHDVVLKGGRLSELLSALRSFLGTNDMMAYITMMAVRLKELHRVLKSTGSIYLHCDPTASHYLKLVMDAIFGISNYQHEITWKRSSAHSDAKQGRKAFGNIADIILYYTKSEEYTFNTQYTPYTPEYIESNYGNTDPDGRKWKSSDLSGPGGAAKGNPEYEFLGVTRFWRFSKENMNKLLADGRIHQAREGSVPRMKHYLDEMPGIPLQNIWDDIPPVQSQASERLGYPTQKPEILLERIIKTSSNEGDIVMDPFCGCGTAISVAEKLHRRWIGIDVTHLAITLIRHRLHNTFKHQLSPFEIIGAPPDLEGAKALAAQDRYQFQWWALGLVDAKPEEKKKGADKGVDGVIPFFDDPTGKVKRVIIQVKSGGVKRSDIATLKSDVEREKAQIGVFMTLENPTKPMYEEAATGGFYEPLYGKKIPKIQILTIENLLDGKRIQLPPYSPVESFKKAPTQKKGLVPEQESFL
jgi:DNA modification methylase